MTLLVVDRLAKTSSSLLRSDILLEKNLFQLVFSSGQINRLISFHSLLSCNNFT